MNVVINTIIIIIDHLTWLEILGIHVHGVVENLIESPNLPDP